MPEGGATQSICGATGDRVDIEVKLVVTDALVTCAPSVSHDATIKPGSNTRAESADMMRRALRRQSTTRRRRFGGVTEGGFGFFMVFSSM